MIWLGDLVVRDGRWVAVPEHIHETAWKKTRSEARKGKADAGQELVRRLARGYRILLSRAIHGTYVWFEDEETRDFVTRALDG